MAKVRRLLEDDLNLEKNTLDAYKSFISDVLDEVNTHVLYSFICVHFVLFYDSRVNIYSSF